jgi:double-stranded RNA-binding protein Staufen
LLGQQAKTRKTPPGKKKSKNLIKQVEVKNGEQGGDGGQSINPISRLIQIQQARKEKEPVYSLVAERGMPRRREFVMQVTVGQQSATGSGPNKKLAKRAAAEALLQLLGYSRPGPQPSKPTLRSPGEGGGEKGRKLTFVDEVNNGAVTNGGRQLVPGLLYIDDKAPKYKTPPIVSGAPVAASQQVNGACNGHSANGHGGQAATIAAELLRGGTSPTAEALVVPQNMPQLPPQGQGVSPKEQLAYLSQVLGFSVSYTDFPKKGEYLSLVSLSTNPPQVSHGAGATLEGSHNNAAHTALRTLASNGLDTVVENGQGKGAHH